MSYKLKIDPRKVEYDGRSFKLIIKDESKFLKELKKRQKELWKRLQCNKLKEN